MPNIKSYVFGFIPHALEKGCPLIGGEVEAVV